MFLAFETLMTAFQMNGAMQTGNIDKTIIDKKALEEKKIKIAGNSTKNNITDTFGEPKLIIGNIR